MKGSRIALAATVALAATALVIPSLHAASSKGSAPAHPSPPGELAQFGHIRSLAARGRFVLRFDPAFWLGGTTAAVAAVEDGAIGPGETVPNDYYIRDESRKVLTYRVPASARDRPRAGTGGIRSQRVDRRARPDREGPEPTAPEALRPGKPSRLLGADPARHRPRARPAVPAVEGRLVEQARTSSHSLARRLARLRDGDDDLPPRVPFPQVVERVGDLAQLVRACR